NVRADPGLAQHCAFFDIGASQKVRSGLFKRAPHLPGAMTVSVGLDHRNQARHPIAPFATDMLDDAPVVRLERVQVDSGNGGTNHGVSCRLSAFGFRLSAFGFRLSAFGSALLVRGAPRFADAFYAVARFSNLV